MTTQESTPSFHSDRIDDSHHEQLVHILDMQAELPSIGRMRAWARNALAATPGERALDIGSGTGSEVLEFAHAVGPTGEAVGVDPNPAMVATATDRARAANVTARFVEGSAYHLPFDGATFDAVRCERVYQHLDDPAAATAEIARVLRPGGRVMLIDSDWHTAITHPGDPDVVRAFSAQMQANSPNPASGRRLRGLLVAAGLDIDDIGSEAVIWNPDSVLNLMQMSGRAAVAAGAVTQPQFDQFTADLTHGIETGDYHLSVTMFAVLAHKP